MTLTMAPGTLSQVNADISSWSQDVSLCLPIWNDGTEVRVVGVADVLIEAGRDADAMSLLIDAQEVSYY